MPCSLPGLARSLAIDVLVAEAQRVGLKIDPMELRSRLENDPDPTKIQRALAKWLSRYEEEDER